MVSASVHIRSVKLRHSLSSNSPLRFLQPKSPHSVVKIIELVFAARMRHSLNFFKLVGKLKKKKFKNQASSLTHQNRAQDKHDFENKDLVGNFLSVKRFDRMYPILGYLWSIVAPSFHKAFLAQNLIIRSCCAVYLIHY